MTRSRAALAVAALALLTACGGGQDATESVAASQAPVVEVSADATRPPTPTAEATTERTPEATTPATTRPATRAPRPAASVPATRAPRAVTADDPGEPVDSGSAYGPTPGAVSFPFDAGRRSWATTRDGIRLVVEIADPTPRAGAPVRVSASATSADTTCCQLDLQYGDGLRDSDNGDQKGCGFETQDGSASRSADHAWNRPGRYQLLVSASSCAGARDVSVLLTVVVSDGPSSTNGARQPTVVFFDLARTPRPADPGLVHVNAQVRDQDGYVFRMVVDWGDGSAPMVLDLTRQAGQRQGPCVQTPGGTSSDTTGFMPGEPNPPAHRYAASGDYVMTLTGYSSGCGGKDVQTVRKTLAYAW